MYSRTVTLHQWGVKDDIGHQACLVCGVHMTPKRFGIYRMVTRRLPFNGWEYGPEDASGDCDVELINTILES